MSEHYNLYESLGLSRAEGSDQIAETLDARLSAHVDRGGAKNDPAYDEAATARAILGDPAKRELYDARLDDPEASLLTITALRELAGQPAQARRVQYRYEPVTESARSIVGAFKAAPAVVSGTAFLALGGALISALAMVLLYLTALRERRGMDALSQMYGVGPGAQVLSAGVVVALAIMAFATALYCLHGVTVAAIALRGSNPLAHGVAVLSTVVLLMLSLWVWLMPLDLAYAVFIYVPYLLGLLVLLLLPDVRAWAAGYRREREVI
ncbi:hypothetical protein MHT86_09380 [Corynebacterium mastitidis]|uniref:J domain-containing protein n=1 Tax=Corynebacterium mastitidis TaxID=161890 RepID=A0A2N0X4X3_9CORY|nr:hypothetical protein [Corynebacterium mastitidis]MCH6197701.1 hypothetical protein [Corynebacterium mastitidis]PKF67746.1 hypothetical protein CXB45_10645 [Corynebacterium mastitidis]